MCNTVDHYDDTKARISHPFIEVNTIHQISGCAALASLVGLIASLRFEFDRTLPTVVFAVSFPLWSLTQSQGIELQMKEVLTLQMPKRENNVEKKAEPTQNTDTDTSVSSTDNVTPTVEL